MENRDQPEISAEKGARLPHPTPALTRRRLGRRFRLGLVLAAIVAGLVGGGRLFLAWRAERSSPLPGTLPADSPVAAEAMELADRIVRDFPGSVDAIHVRGLILYRLGNTTEAVDCWEICLRKAPEFTGAHFWIGWDALRRGEYEHAIARFHKALQIDPGFAEARLRLAEALVNAGSVEEAIPVLEQYVAAVPGSVEGKFRLGQGYARVGKFGKATEWYQEALKLDPTCRYAYYGLARAYARLGQTETARRFQEQFQELEGNQRAAASTRKREYDDVIELRRGMANVYMVAGRLYLAHGKSSEAEVLWEKAVAADPQNAENRETLIDLYERQGKLQEAIPLLEDLRRIEPDDPDRQGAPAPIARAAELDPENPRYRQVHAQIREGAQDE